jgi:hypothetical protein
VPVRTTSSAVLALPCLEPSAGPRLLGTGKSTPVAPLTTMAHGESLLMQISLFALGTAHPCGGLAKRQYLTVLESSLLMPLSPEFTAAAPPQVRCRPYCPALSLCSVGDSAPGQGRWEVGKHARSKHPLLDQSPPAL